MPTTVVETARNGISNGGVPLDSPDSESFFELVDPTFQGDRVRVCVIDNVKMVSVFDVLSIVTESTGHSSLIYRRLCDANPCVESSVRMFKFSGEGESPTPVVDAKGFHVIAMLVPGRRAGEFRVNVVETLKKYLE